MKKFVPGEIARAEDVNANFAELKTVTDKLANGIQTGRVGLGAYKPNETYSKSVTFPRPFAAPPFIAVSCTSQRLRIAIYSVTATGFSFYGWNDTSAANGDDATFDWIAISNIN